MRAILSVQNLYVAYGAVQAVKGVSFYLHAGEIVAIIGANGAGKTTTLKALAGVLLPASGDIWYDGKRLGNRPSFKRVREGLALVPEGRSIFNRLTVKENLEIGAYTRVEGRAEISADIEKMFWIFPRLKERAKQPAGTLSGGEQQMLAISRALMSRPRLLLLDEPSMGLAPLVVQLIFETLTAIVKEGVTLLLVEQNAQLALQSCERAYVMEGGRIRAEGQSQTLLESEAVQRAYLGQ